MAQLVLEGGMPKRNLHDYFSLIHVSYNSCFFPLKSKSNIPAKVLEVEACS